MSMIIAKSTDTVADLAARIREDRAKPPRPGQIVTQWAHTPEAAAEMMIWAAKEKERLESWEAQTARIAVLKSEIGARAVELERLVGAQRAAGMVAVAIDAARSPAERDAYRARYGGAG